MRVTLVPMAAGPVRRAAAGTARVGTAKFARLSTLNTSSRNCSSVLPQRLVLDERQVDLRNQVHGKFRGVVPNGGAKKALVSNQWSGLPVMIFFGSVPGLTLGRSSAVP